MTKEYLSIENFAGLNEKEIELGRMNVFIGPQASGKSVCAKLFFFFKDCASGIASEAINERTKVQIQNGHRDTFLMYFPPDYWGKGMFKLHYSCGELWIQIERKASEAATIKISYSSQYAVLLKVARQMFKVTQSASSIDTGFTSTRKIYQDIINKIDQRVEPPLANRNYFIPAGRSFFSTLRTSVFQFIANDLDIDPFLVNFGRFYEEALRNFTIFMDHRIDDNHKIAQHMLNLLSGTYKRVKTQGYMIMDDNRQIAIEYCSSGQQEALPLAMVLSRMALTNSGRQRSTIFIEEPEAHLYPSAQREIVHLFVAAMDLSSASSSQYVITTHSPYILSALNNLMYAGKIAHDFPERRSRVAKVLGEDMLVDPADVRAYFVSGGRITSIIDAETGLVNAAKLDSVSGELAEEFEKLVDIEFDEKIEDKVA